MIIRIREAPREADEIILFALREKQRGVRVHAIAKRLDMDPAYVSAMMQRVKNSDAKECAYWGDNPKKIRGFYE